MVDAEREAHPLDAPARGLRVVRLGAKADSAGNRPRPHDDRAPAAIVEEAAEDALASTQETVASRRWKSIRPSRADVALGDHWMVDRPVTCLQQRISASACARQPGTSGSPSPRACRGVRVPYRSGLPSAGDLGVL